ncbi:MAG: hypothetical protein HFG20_06130 [Anaerotruncus sp.]|jgi:hypothetical protein|nr:hypothetical protein [Anaerotruncus sp.]
MPKKDLRLFAASFFITLLLFGFGLLFLVVDASGSRYEARDMVPALAVRQQDALHYQVALLGQWYPLTLEPFNQIEAWRKEYACLVMPIPVRALEEMKDFVIYGAKVLYNQYKEEQYLQNVANEPQ